MSLDKTCVVGATIRILGKYESCAVSSKMRKDDCVVLCFFKKNIKEANKIISKINKYHVFTDAKFKNKNVCHTRL